MFDVSVYDFKLKPFWLIILMMINVEALAQFYHVLRYNDADFSFLKTDSTDHDLFNPIKYIRIGKSEHSYMTIGGELRETYQLLKNENWGDVSPDRIDADGFLWHRFMLHGDLIVGKNIRLFTQLKNTNVSGRRGGSRPTIDKDVLDLQQAFLDFKWQQSKDRWLLRIGRQEFNYGWGKLISVREGPNNRQSFDAISVQYARGNWNTDLFYAINVGIRDGVFDNPRLSDQKIWGTYNTLSLPKFFRSKAELYYIGSTRNSMTLADIHGNDKRATIGFRISTKKTGFLYDWESIYQFGWFSNKKISAYSIVGMVGYEWEHTKAKPTVTLYAALTSGDKDSTDNAVGTFNPLYPRPPFTLGLPLGPSNVNAWKLEIAVKPSQKTTASLGSYGLWRNSASDITYTPAVTPLKTLGQASLLTNKSIGFLYFFEFEYHTRHLTLNAQCLAAPAGKFTRETGNGKTIQYLLAQATYKF